MSAVSAAERCMRLLLRGDLNIVGGMVVQWLVSVVTSQQEDSGF